MNDLKFAQSSNDLIFSNLKFQGFTQNLLRFLNIICIQITVWQDMMVGQHLILHIAASEDGQVSLSPKVIE